MIPLLKTLEQKLENRKKQNAFRVTSMQSGKTDFVTNDYLGLGKRITEHNNLISSTGASRLLTGSFTRLESLEQHAARFHGHEAALFFNSGYTANLALFSVLLSRHDTYIIDEFVHASIRDGIRLSMAPAFTFRHNSPNDLEKKLVRAKGHCVVVTESLFSMDGDFAPLQEILEICERRNAGLIVDEAHTNGLYGEAGSGFCNELNLHHRLLARIVTYGKAFGSHGACVLGSNTLRNALINYARPFIYTTAPAPALVEDVWNAYASIAHADTLRDKLRKNISFFVQRSRELNIKKLMVQQGPIQLYMAGDNTRARTMAEKIQQEGYEVRAVLSPTVPEGTERLRICLHAYNSTSEILGLANILARYE